MKLFHILIILIIENFIIKNVSFYTVKWLFLQYNCPMQPAEVAWGQACPNNCSVGWTIGRPPPRHLPQRRLRTGQATDARQHRLTV